MEGVELPFSEEDGLALLRAATNDPQASFREGQWEAISALINDRRRVLLVRRTGWGKSIIYFIATALLRRGGAGPTVIVSPLLSLMRNQIEAATRFEIRADRIDSTNEDRADEIFQRLEANEIDLLLISPERLGNAKFRERAGENLFGRLGMLVIDEAHCISDWGHDFRPDYRRLQRYVRFLPPNIPIIATTATASQQVVDDVQEQLGGNVLLNRGELSRDTLSLDIYSDLSYAQRLAWIAGAVADLPGSGIIYALTVRDVNTISEWLASRKIDVLPYHGKLTDEERVAREELLLRGDVKALVATTALGMGYDNPRIGFVVHFNSAKSVVDYYQQVGRAGRAAGNAYAVLLSGDDEREVVEYFVHKALPPQELVNNILQALEDSDDGLSSRGLTGVINEPNERILNAIKFLEVEDPSPLYREAKRYRRTAVPYKYPQDRVDALRARRLREWDEMQQYVQSDDCRMVMLSVALGDTTASPCGRCIRCIGDHIVSVKNFDELCLRAEDFLARSEISITPRRKWPDRDLPAYGFFSNRQIPGQLMADEGRALAWFNVGLLGRRLHDEMYDLGRFSEDTIERAVVLLGRWNPQPAAKWITAMPSTRHAELVPAFARALAERLQLRYVEALVKTRDTEEQKRMQNSSYQASNLDGALEVVPFEDMESPGLFIDDLYRSGWTATVAIALLRRAGAGPVRPLVALKVPAGD